MSCVNVWLNGEERWEVILPWPWETFQVSRHNFGPERVLVPAISLLTSSYSYLLFYFLLASHMTK